MFKVSQASNSATPDMKYFTSSSDPSSLKMHMKLFEDEDWMWKVLSEKCPASPDSLVG
jgi:hypothetical protein